MSVTTGNLFETCEYDPSLAIHEAVLAAKENKTPTNRRSRLKKTPPKPQLTVEKILAWADEHYRVNGSWPHQQSGEVVGVPGQSWVAVDAALRHGRRGLIGGSSLARLLAECRGVCNPKGRPVLTVETILKWADRYYATNRSWPNASSGTVVGQRHETWARVDCALREGIRGLPGSSSLAK